MKYESNQATARQLYLVQRFSEFGAIVIATNLLGNGKIVVKGAQEKGEYTKYT